ncbi:MAG: sensor domain-containing protein [Methylomonas sp.]
MNKNTSKNGKREKLRHLSEKNLPRQPTPGIDTSPNEKKLLHELQVHQIELETQNEELWQARDAEKKSLARYTDLFDSAPIAYFNLALDGRMLHTNFCGARLLGRDRDDLSGLYLLNFIQRQDQPVFTSFLHNVLVGDGSDTCEVCLEAAEAKSWVRMEGALDCQQHGYLLAVMDITERKHHEEASQFAAIVYQALGEAIMVADKNNTIIMVNPAFTALTGYTAEEACGKTTSLLKSGRQGVEFYREMWERLNTIGRWQGEIWNKHKNGEIFQQWLMINNVYDELGEISYRVGQFSDTTDRKRTEELIHKQALIDPLTELPNRRLFLARLKHAIQRCQRNGEKLAVMFLDLDHFKDINDTLGHDISDKLLKEVAGRLKKCIRETDTLARPGGDEFILILEELNETDCAERVAQNLLHCMEAPFHLGNEYCYISISIGIAFYPDDAIEKIDLLKKADQAMYVAKHLGRKRYCHFTPAMQRATQQRLRLSNDLRKALAENQLLLNYQPIVDLATGSIRKAEALIRWHHPERGVISPAEFIPIAEETGLIIEIGEWSFRQAADQVRHWRSGLQSDFQVSVNNSPRQLYSRGQHKGDWFDYLADQDLPGNSIAVEITEDLLLEASPLVIKNLKRLRDAGLQISLDDFGTGYSALSYLTQFEIDYLKIDQSFVRNLSATSTNLALCEAMIVLAHKLGMKVIAEGIETPEQKNLLAQAGCDYGQGYLFAKPLAVADFESLFVSSGSFNMSAINP